MIDVHFHCLPGIDDGPRTWEESVALCKAAAADGVTTIIATPHVLRDNWLNEDSTTRAGMVAKLNELLKGKPQILPGCEYYFSSDAEELWSKGSGGPLTGLNESSYLLIEFPATRIPEQAESVLYEMTLRGAKPVIAHPERNLVFAERPEKLERFIELGAIAQVTAASVTGAFGRAAYAATEEFFKRGLIHVVASDSHNIDKRPPAMSSARKAVRQRWGSDADEQLFESMPQLIVENATREAGPE